jgi:hypothetical protein
MHIKTKRIHLLFDFALLILGGALSVWLFQSKILENLFFLPMMYKFVAIFVAGIFIPFIFTAAPASVVMLVAAKIVPFYALAVFGGLGALFGDLVVFRFSKKQLGEDLTYIVSLDKEDRLAHILHLRIFRWMTPLFFVLIIASPIPDEYAVALLGLEKVAGGRFVLMTFLIHASAILCISLFS